MSRERAALSEDKAFYLALTLHLMKVAEVRDGSLRPREAVFQIARGSVVGVRVGSPGLYVQWCRCAAAMRVMEGDGWVFWKEASDG